MFVNTVLSVLLFVSSSFLQSPLYILFVKGEKKSIKLCLKKHYKWTNRQPETFDVRWTIFNGRYTSGCLWCTLSSRGMKCLITSMAWAKLFTKTTHLSWNMWSTLCIKNVLKEKKNDRRDTWYMQKQFCVKRNIERLFGLAGIHRWDSFLILPPSGWETALHTCTFLLLMFTPDLKAGYDWSCPFFVFFFPFLSDIQKGINVSSVSGLFRLLSLDYMVKFWSEKKNEKKKQYFYPLSTSKPSRVISVAMLLFYSCCETW